ncbi:MAG: hypothetical protein JSS64_08475 [Bacteroidetes bacterium]|nr:hypothetical protein [Bacteroidota bacterium]
MATINNFTVYSVAALPTTGIDVNGMYLADRGAGKFSVSIRKLDNSDWVHLGILNGVDTVNGLTGAVQVNLSFTNGVLSITGGGVTVDLDARYTRITDAIPWSRISGAPTTRAGYGITDAVGNTGNETIAGTKTFSSSPVIPDGTAANHAASKGQMDTADASLQAQINDLASTVAEGIRTPTDIDCSANPNYPASTKGDSYKVTVAGKIGGASGKPVSVGDLIVCKTTSAAGIEAVVGANFYIVEGNLDQATETVAGVAKIATDTQTASGNDDSTIITPRKLQQKINAERTTSDGKYVRVDAAQGLSNEQKVQARTNTGAADDASVVHKTGNETVAGIKTFSSSPVIPDPTADTHAANRQWTNTAIEAGKTKFVRDW